MGYQFSSFRTGQVVLANTATLIAAANSARTAIVITNTSTTDIYLGDASVTTSTGQLLVGNKGASITLPTTGAVYGIVAAATPTVTFTEITQ